MAGYKVFLVLTLLLGLSQVNAVDFAVVDNTGDTAGGKVFREQVGGVAYGRQSLSSATDFVWRVFQQDKNPSDRRPAQKITLFMEKEVDGGAVALTYPNGDIRYSAKSLEGSSGEEAKRGFDGVIYHEVTHVWQWGLGQAPSGLTEGIADFVRLKAGYVPGHWVKPGEGDKWDHGYDVTARFLDYCESLKNGFVAELNKKLKDGYNESFFVELLGKDVNQLWTDYKAKYGQ